MMRIYMRRKIPASTILARLKKLPGYEKAELQHPLGVRSAGVALRDKRCAEQPHEKFGNPQGARLEPEEQDARNREQP